MKYCFPFLLFLLSFSFVQAQFPPLEMSADVVTTPSGGTVDVSVRAGNNWQNITTINGTITFDTTVIDYQSMVFWGLSFPQGASFTYHGGGVLSWTWTSLITIGPTLMSGAPVFTLRFNVVGNPGSMTNLTFGNNPQALFWANGFAWSGNNFTLSNGSVTVICGQSAANFGAAVNLFTVNYTDSSSTNVFSYLWDFGDGNTSTQQNPTHTYATGGTYTACLTVTDSCGTDSTCQTVVVCPAPTAAFSQQANMLSYTFSDNSSATATNWLWDFGDGNTSTMQNPTHVYASPGNYTVCLTVTDPCGSDSTCQTFSACLAPMAAFSSQPNNLSYNFTDNSTLTPTSWFWILGDGNTSTLQNPSHTYALPGNYQVCLIATNACGSDTSCTAIVVSCPAPVAMFSQVTTSLSAAFTDLSTNTPTSWLWDFGDGNTSTLQNPSHTYAQPGTYTVCLTATALCGSDSSCTAVVVSCPAPVAAFSSAVNMSAAQFTDLSTVTPTAWLWDFGDGNTSTMQNPSHTYAADGNYLVCLIASSLCGADTTCDTVSIVTVGLPNLGATAVEVYPNPARDWLRVRVGTGQSILGVEVFDLQGQVIAELPGEQQQELLLDLADTAAGLYFIQVTTSEGKLISKVLME